MKTTIFSLILLGLVSVLSQHPIDAQEVETESSTEQEASGSEEKSETGEDSETSKDSETGAVDETTLTIPEETDENPIQNRETLTTFTLWDFIRMVLILGGVILLIYGIFFILKRFSGRKLQNNELFTIMASQSIGNNKALHLIEVGRQIFIIGTADNSVSLISEIQDKESIDEIRFKHADSGGALEQRNFKEILYRFFGGAGSGRPEEKNNEMNQSIEFIKKQRERLKKL